MQIENCIHQNHIFRARPHLALIHPKFVSYHGNFFGQDWFTKTGKQTTNLASINKGVLSRFPVPLAPINEQTRIVAKIEELFSDLDAGVANLLRVRANLKRYRAAVLKAAVEGKLTEEWRTKHPNVEPDTALLERILIERRRKWEDDQLVKFAQAGKQPPKGWREKYHEPLPPDVQKDWRLPAAWCLASVEQISHFAKYGSSAKTSDAADGVPVLRMGNIQGGRLDLSNLKYLPADHDEFPELLLEKGDLLFNRTNSAELVGKSAVFEGAPSPCSFASYLIVVKAVEGCDSRMLCYYLNSIFGRAWIGSVVSQQVGQANVNGTKLQALVFPLPNESEQAEIIQEVERRFSIVDETRSSSRSQPEASLPASAGHPETGVRGSPRAARSERRARRTTPHSHARSTQTHFSGDQRQPPLPPSRATPQRRTDDAAFRPGRRRGPGW